MRRSTLVRAVRFYRVIATFALATTLLIETGRAVAHEGDPHVEHEIALSYVGPRLPTGAANALEAVEAIVKLGAKVHNQAGQALFPSGTVVDATAWNENVLEIRLTLPTDRPIDWRLTPLDLETITSALHKPFKHDSAFGGTHVRVRRSVEGPYESLEEITSQPRIVIRADGKIEVVGDPQRTHDLWRGPLDLLPEGTEATESAPDATPSQADTSEAAGTRGGPVANAGRQPAGALSGVTVYVSAGHGWTAGASNWVLQRPLLLDMCEDYGNIDVVNLFATYAFNAGATVVPLRPVGWQPIEIVLDNDDPGVTYSGSWSNSGGAQYYENGATNSGVPYRFANTSAIETATARFTPNITTTDFYPVYCFTIAGTNRVRQTYRIAHDGGVTEVGVDHRNVGNGWVWLGSYYMAAGGTNYVEISNASPTAGVVVADAVRFGGGYGDVTRPGPGGDSGYPRDEEAQRYWAESEWGNNAVGFDSSLWDPSGADDNSDNIGAGGRLAREMNQVPAGGVGVERWKRVHLEFHSNAFGSGARGQLCLITDLGATTNQTQYATILSNEIDADMTLLSNQGEFEHPWIDRAAATLTGSYGAIATSANSNEFDATLVELAFHDNDQDAALLRDPRVRSYMARACVQGIVRFLSTHSGGQVPLAFAPDTPREFAARDSGGGNVQLSWIAPQADAARGDAATGYVVYQSNSGVGFGSPIVLGNATSTTVSGVPVGQTRYFRIAATNAGGESMPSEVLAVRRPASGTATVLIVNGFDRLRRQQNPIQTFTQPPAYAGQSIERQQWRESNAFDYVIEHGEALAAAGFGFSSCANEAVASGAVPLGGFQIVDWMLGVESVEDFAFTTAEQSRLTTYLNGGGKLFISGADVAYDLINQGRGVNFAQDTLRVGYAQNDANSYSVSATASGLLAGVAAFDFNPAAGAAFDVREPDALTTRTDSIACLNYATGGVAGVQFASGTYSVVTFGFPFEAISSGTVRATVMQRVTQWLLTAGGPQPFDFDNDGDVDFNDFQVFLFCWQGPGITYPPGQICLEFDGDGDSDVDMADFRLMQAAVNAP